MEKTIKITRDGPYIMFEVPIYEKRIVCKDGLYIWEDGRELPQSDICAMCRSGRSNGVLFCDGRGHRRFRRDEITDRRFYAERGEKLKGSGMDLLEDIRCGRSTWDFLKESDCPRFREELVRPACECPAGKTVLVGKNGTVVKDDMKPAIYIIQDDDRSVSSEIYPRRGTDHFRGRGALRAQKQDPVLPLRCAREQVFLRRHAHQRRIQGLARWFCVQEERLRKRWKGSRSPAVV